MAHRNQWTPRSEPEFESDTSKVVTPIASGGTVVMKTSSITESEPPVRDVISGDNTEIVLVTLAASAQARYDLRNILLQCYKV